MKNPENKKEVTALFKQGPDILRNALTDLSDTELDYKPSKGGWTIRQIVHHLADGDDIWKYCIKMALGNEQAEFSLNWYQAYPQTEWAKNWNYEKRPTDVSLALLEASRDHILQILEYATGAWNKSVTFSKPDGKTEQLPVGFIIQMQAEHIVHHVKRIKEIREEITANN